MYYFAYGSNMSLDHMRRICGWHCHMLGRASLPNFELGVDLRGYANIRPKNGQTVHGMLYEIDEDGMAMLDEFEGYPQVFGRQQVVVLDEHKVKYKAQVYIEITEQFGGKAIKEEYFRRVISAATENRLPEDWIVFLKKTTEGKQKI